MQGKLTGALLVALALGGAACGSASKPLSTDQLRAQAGVICRDMTRRVLALNADATQATMRSALGRAAIVMSDGVERLQSLTPPEQMADRYARLVEWKHAQAEAARELAHGRQPTGRSGEAIRGHENPASGLSRELRINGC